MLDRLIGSSTNSSRNNATTIVRHQQKHRYYEQQQQQEQQSFVFRPSTNSLLEASKRDMKRQKRRIGTSQAFKVPPSVEIRDVLAQLGLENEQIACGAEHNFKRIYGDRASGKGLRKTEVKEKAAIAFSVANTLIREGVPRPLEDVAAASGFEGGQRPLLDIVKYIPISKEERKKLKEWEFTISDETGPSDYVDVVCANLNIPFKTATQVHNLISDCDLDITGKNPLIVLAALLIQVLEDERGGEEVPPELVGKICSITRCQYRSLHEVKCWIKDRQRRQQQQQQQTWGGGGTK